MKLGKWQVGNKDYCQTCGEYMFASSRHRCQPLWHVCEKPSWPEKAHLDDLDYWSEVHAYDEQEAAEKFAEEIDDEGPNDHDLIVRRPDGSMVEFSVSYEHKIDYHAYEGDSYSAAEVSDEEEQ